MGEITEAKRWRDVVTEAMTRPSYFEPMAKAGDALLAALEARDRRIAELEAAMKARDDWDGLSARIADLEAERREVMKAKVTVRPGCIKVNSIVQSYVSQDVLILDIDFASKYAEWLTYGDGETPGTMVFYIDKTARTLHTAEGDDATEITVAVPAEWSVTEDDFLMATIDLARYSGTIMIRKLPDEDGEILWAKDGGDRIACDLLGG